MRELRAADLRRQRRRGALRTRGTDLERAALVDRYEATSPGPGNGNGT